VANRPRSRAKSIFAILLDRAIAAPLIVASTEGGVEIETVAAKSPDKIIPRTNRSAGRRQPFQNAQTSRSNSDSSNRKQRAMKIVRWALSSVRRLRLFNGGNQSAGGDRKKGDVLALDAKFNFDDNALYRIRR